MKYSMCKWEWERGKNLTRESHPGEEGLLLLFSGRRSGDLSEVMMAAAGIVLSHEGRWVGGGGGSSEPVEVWRHFHVIGIVEEVLRTLLECGRRICTVIVDRGRRNLSHIESVIESGRGVRVWQVDATRGVQICCAPVITFVVIGGSPIRIHYNGSLKLLNWI